MCAKNISDIDSDHLGIVCHAVPCEIKWNKEGKPGFQIYGLSCIICIININKHAIVIIQIGCSGQCVSDIQ